MKQAARCREQGVVREKVALVLVQMPGVGAAHPQGRRCRVGCAVARQGDRLIAGEVGC